MKENILVVAAHADDEVLGCGGAIAKYSELGARIKVVIMADGESSRAGGKERIETRKQVARKSLQILGVSDVLFLNLPDNGMDQLPRLEIIKKFAEVVGDFRPHTIFTHFCNDLNIDHQITQAVVQTHFRPLPNSSVKEIYSFEVLSSTNWQYGVLPFAPNVFIELSNTNWLKKMEALKVYNDEMVSFPHARSYQSLEALAALRGATMGVPLAESFLLLRALK